MSPNPETQELEDLFPGETYKLTNTGEEIVVKPVTIGKLRVFIDAVSSILFKLESSGIKNIEDPAAWPVVLATAHGEVLKIMGAVLKKDEAWFDEVLLPVDAVHIFGMIIKQNVNDDLKKKFLDLGKLVRSVMPTSSSSLSRTATGT